MTRVAVHIHKGGKSGLFIIKRAKSAKKWTIESASEYAQWVKTRTLDEIAEVISSKNMTVVKIPLS